MIKKIIPVLLSFMLFIMMFVHVFAMENTTAEIAFTINDSPGSVVIEAIDNAPLPEQTKLNNVTEGSFKMTYSEPDTYKYKIYQIAGTEENIKYDENVYNVTISVMVNEDGNLYTIVTISINDDMHKPNAIIFENEKFIEQETPSKTPQDTPQTSDESNLMFYVLMSGLSFFAMCVSLVVFLLDKKKNSME